MSIDPKSFAAHDTNLYRYVGDSPLNSTDPSGMQQPNLPTDNPIARKALAELNLATVQKSLKAERDKQAAREKTIVTFAGGEEAAAKLIVQYERDIAALFKRNVDLGQIVIGAEVNLGIMDALKKAHVRGEMARFAYIELKGIRARIDSLEIDEAYQIQLVHYYDILAFNAAHPGINVPAIVPRRDQNAPANPPNQPGRGADKPCPENPV